MATGNGKLDYLEFPGFTWKRPKGPPRNWRVVNGRRKMTSGEISRFSIQEVPKELEDDVVEFMLKNYATEEPVNADIGLDSDPLALHETKLFLRIIVRQGVSVVALTLNSDPTAQSMIAGVNILSILDAKDGVNIANLITQFKSNILRTAWEVQSKVVAESNILKIYGVDKYLSSFGLSVHPSFRGQGLGEEFLRVRDDIGLAYKIPVSATIFSSTVSQILAARVGYEVLLEKKYSEILDQEGNVAWPSVSVKYMKHMGKRLY